MTDQEVLQYYVDHSDKTYPSLLLALTLTVMTLQAQVESLEEGLPPLINLDMGTF